MYSAFAYYNSCTLEVRSYSSEDEGKVIKVTNGNRTFTETLSNGKAIFKMLPSKGAYTITVLNNETEEYTNEVILNSGEYKVHELNEPEPLIVFDDIEGTIITTITARSSSAKTTLASYTFEKDYDLVMAVLFGGFFSGYGSVADMTTNCEEYTMPARLSGSWGGNPVSYTSQTLILRNVKAGDKITTNAYVTNGSISLTVIEL